MQVRMRTPRKDKAMCGHVCPYGHTCWLTWRNQQYRTTSQHFRNEDLEARATYGKACTVSVLPLTLRSFCDNPLVSTHDLRQGDLTSDVSFLVYKGLLRTLTPHSRTGSDKNRINDFMLYYYIARHGEDYFFFCALRLYAWSFSIPKLGMSLPPVKCLKMSSSCEITWMIDN